MNMINLNFVQKKLWLNDSSEAKLRILENDSVKTKFNKNSVVTLNNKLQEISR